MKWLVSPMKWLVSPVLWKILLPVSVTLLVWFLNEHSKRDSTEYVRKEQRYVELVKSLRGFHVVAQPDAESVREARQKFLDQLNLCWLYCPDEVVRKGYQFLETVKKGANSTPLQRRLAAGEFIPALRKDLFADRSTSPEADNFQILKVE